MRIIPIPSDIQVLNVNEPKQRTIFLSNYTNLNNILLTLIAMYATVSLIEFI